MAFVFVTTGFFDSHRSLVAKQRQLNRWYNLISIAFLQVPFRYSRPFLSGTLFKIFCSLIAGIFLAFFTTDICWGPIYNHRSHCTLLSPCWTGLNEFLIIHCILLSLGSVVDSLVVLGIVLFCSLVGWDSLFVKFVSSSIAVDSFAFSLSQIHFLEQDCCFLQFQTVYVRCSFMWPLSVLEPLSAFAALSDKFFTKNCICRCS